MSGPVDDRKMPDHIYDRPNAASAAHSAIGRVAPRLGSPAARPAEDMESRALDILALNKRKKALEKATEGKVGWFGRLIGRVPPESDELSLVRSKISAETEQFDREIHHTIVCLRKGPTSPNPLHEGGMEPLKQFCDSCRYASKTRLDHEDEKVLKRVIELRLAEIKSLCPAATVLDLKRFTLNEQVLLLSQLVETLRNQEDPIKRNTIFFFFKNYARGRIPKYPELKRLLKLLENVPDFKFYSELSRSPGVVNIPLGDLLNFLDVTKDVPKHLHYECAVIISRLPEKAVKLACRLRLKVRDKSDPMPLLLKISRSMAQCDRLVNRAKIYMAEKDFQFDSTVADLLEVLEKIPECDDLQLLALTAEQQLTGYECVKLLRTVAPLSSEARQNLINFINSTEVGQLWVRNVAPEDSYYEIRERFFRIIDDAIEIIPEELLIDFVQKAMPHLIRIYDQQQCVDVIKSLVAFLPFDRISDEDMIRLMPKEIIPKKPVLLPEIKGIIGAFLPDVESEGMRLLEPDFRMDQAREGVFKSDSVDIAKAFEAEKQKLINELLAAYNFNALHINSAKQDAMRERLQTKLSEIRDEKSRLVFYDKLASIFAEKIFPDEKNITMGLCLSEFISRPFCDRLFSPMSASNVELARKLGGSVDLMVVLFKTKLLFGTSQLPIWQDPAFVAACVNLDPHMALRINGFFSQNGTYNNDNELVVRAVLKVNPSYAYECSNRVLKLINDRRYIVEKIQRLKGIYPFFKEADHKNSLLADIQDLEMFLAQS